MSGISGSSNKGFFSKPKNLKPRIHSLKSLLEYLYILKIPLNSAGFEPKKYLKRKLLPGLEFEPKFWKQ